MIPESTNVENLVSDILDQFTDGQPLSEILEALAYATASSIVLAAGGDMLNEELLLRTVCSDVEQKVRGRIM